MKKLLYNGCIRQAGHFLFEDEDGLSISRRPHLLKIDANTDILEYLDGTFTPKKYISGYNDCVVPPFRIVSWWDTSLDHRTGSNSTLVGYGYESAEQMIDDAYKQYPTVMNRQPRPIKAVV
jgi:hypothetical protein